MQAYYIKVMSLEEIKRKYDFVAFSEELGSSGSTDSISNLDLDIDTHAIWDRKELGGMIPSAKVIEVWDREYHSVMINGKFAVKPYKHNYPRIPFFPIPNNPEPHKPWGVSDLVDFFDVNADYTLDYGRSLSYNGPGPVGTRQARILFSIDEDRFWNLMGDLLTQ